MAGGAMEDLESQCSRTYHQESAGPPPVISRFSVTDILVALYFHVMRIDPQNPTDNDRDRCILSKGHPDMNKTPGVDFASGSLGNGLGIGPGMGIPARANRK
jgi:transketolase N-terminal domain/subunit